MSYYEAVEDKILITKQQNGFTSYHPPCYICGTPINSWKYVRGQKYCCSDCREILVKQYKEEKSEITMDKKRRKLALAIKRIDKVADITKYDKAISIVEKKLDKPGWFQSTEEIMVAIELIRRGVKAHHQVKVSDYTVDFVLPDLKVVLEIDGKIYHGKEKEQYEQLRDIIITEKFGAGWEIIHISTDNINKNVTKLMKAINAVVKKRKKDS